MSSTFVRFFRSIMEGFGSGQDGAQGQGGQLRLDRLATSWAQMIIQRDEENEKAEVELGKDVQQSETNGTVNGLVLYGGNKPYVLPEEVLEKILSHCPVEDIMKYNQVCRKWKTLTTKRPYWKSVFKNNGYALENIPYHLMERDNMWLLLKAIIDDDILTKNFVQNPSGENTFENWESILNGGGGIQIEENPVGCDPLPEDSEFPTSTCFSTSFEWCEMLQDVDIGNRGVTPSVMKLLMPFKIELTVMVGTRFDCRNVGYCSLQLQNACGTRAMKSATFTSVAGTHWKLLKFGIVVRDEMINNTIPPIQKVIVTLRGKDDQYWLGNYGPKFSRVSLKIHVLQPEEDEDDKTDERMESNEDGFHLEVMETMYYF